MEMINEANHFGNEGKGDVKVKVMKWLMMNMKVLMMILVFWMK
jgi:hypothetical protein